MVLLSKPEAVGALDGMKWNRVHQDVLFEVQRYQLGEAGKMFGSFLVGSKAKDFRLVSKGKAPMEIAVADTLDEIEGDADMLRLFMVGVVPEGTPIPAPVRQALQEGAARIGAELSPEPLAEQVSDMDSAEVAAAAEAVPSTAVVQWTKPELLTQLEPWAVSLLENADRVRYVCYALKVATSLGAEGATGGFAGEEILSLTFAGVDALLVSSWLCWFLKSLNDDTPGGNVIKEVVALDFVGGPEAVLERVDAICEKMTPDEVEHVTKLAMVLKRRIAVVAGDIVSLMVPNDAGLSGTVITELLIRMQPKDAGEMLGRLMDLYGMISAEHRGVLESHDQLHSLLEASSHRLRDAIFKEYDRPADKKMKRACTRSAALLAVGLIPPFGPVMGAASVANLMGSAAVHNNAGRESCNKVFTTLDGNMPNIVDTVQRALGMSFGVLVLLARCADKATPEQQQAAVVPAGRGGSRGLPAGRGVRGGAPTGRGRQTRRAGR